MHGRSAAVGAVALLLSAGCAAGLRHPEFKARHPHIHSVAVLPPEVEVYRLTFQGDREMMYDLLDPIAQQAAEEVASALEKRGYDVRPLDLTSDTLSANPDLRNSLHTVRTLFAKALEDHSKRMFGPLRRFQYTVGPDINVFADQADSDVLVMVRCTGFKKTGGEIAKDWTKTILIAAATLGSVVVHPRSSVTLIQMAVIDGNTGDLLWYVDNLAYPAVDIAKEKAFRSTVRGMMSGFPKAMHSKTGTTSKGLPGPTTAPTGAVGPSPGTRPPTP